MFIQRPRRFKFSKVIIATMIVSNIIFAVAVLYVFLKTGKEPVELIRIWGAFTCTELWSSASIKKKEVKHNE